MNSLEKRYIDGSYLAENPNWDREDAPWKAAIVQHILSDNQIKPASICEVGCGSGDVLVHLGKHLPDTMTYSDGPIMKIYIPAGFFLKPIIT